MKIEMEEVTQDSTNYRRFLEHDLEQDNLETCQLLMKQSYRVWLSYSAGQVGFFYGIIPDSLLSDRAYMWAWAGPGLKKYPITWARFSLTMIQNIRKEFPVIYGICSVDVKWAKFLGAKIGPEVEGYPSFVIGD